jgi:hypothetical protein
VFLRPVVIDNPPRRVIDPREVAARPAPGGFGTHARRRGLYGMR